MPHVHFAQIHLCRAQKAKNFAELLLLIIH